MASLAFRCKLLTAAALTLAGLVLVGDASALQKGTKKNTSPNATLVKELAAARHLLHMADHDYKGHRVQAIHQITKAMHALDPNHKHKAGTKTTTDPIPQSVSDMHLQTVLTQLQTIQMQLNNVTTGNPVLANTHLTNAVTELKTALSIK